MTIISLLASSSFYDFVFDFEVWLIDLQSLSVYSSIDWVSVMKKTVCWIYELWCTRGTNDKQTMITVISILIAVCIVSAIVLILVSIGDIIIISY